jgi:hypothetical protein
MKAILKQNICAIKKYVIPGEGFGIAQQQILEIDADMTIGELMQKMIGMDDYCKPKEYLKDDKGNLISRSDCRAKNTEDSIELKWTKPLNEEWEISQ